MAKNIEELPPVGDEKAAYEWAKEKRILRQNCQSCNAPLQIYLKSKDPIDNLLICAQSDCERRKHSVSCLEGTIFISRKTYDLSKQIHLFKYWCSKEVTNRGVGKILGMRTNTVLDTYQKCYEFIRNYFQKNPIKLGGKNVVVGVKIHDLCNTNIPNRKWLLVMVDTSRSPLIGFMKLLKDVEAPPNNVSPLLLQVINLVVEPLSIIASDELKIPIQEESGKFTFQNFSNCQRKDLESYIDSHSKTIQKIKRRDIVTPEHYLYESLWRERFQHDAFNIFIDQLGSYNDS